MTMHVRSAAGSDVGQARDHNEDSCVAEHPLYAVADGVGGSAKGEVASSTAIERLKIHSTKIASAASAADASTAMEAAIVSVNEAVHTAQLTNEEQRGMATTMSALVIRDGGEIVIGHVGDSRCYLIGGAGITQITDDHSVVGELVRSGDLQPAEAAHHPQRNVITRAIGPDSDVSVDVRVLHVGPGDWLLLCSDGLTGHVSDTEIERAVIESATIDPQHAVQRLIDQANARGGSDNITVVLVQPLGSDVSGELSVIETVAPVAPATSVTTQPAASDATAVDKLDAVPYQDATGAVRSHTVRNAILITIFVLIAFGAGLFVWTQSYFLDTDSNGNVTIERGFPVFGLHDTYQRGTVLAEDLSASDRQRFIESHELRSREDAVKHLQRLPDRVQEPQGVQPTKP